MQFEQIITGAAGFVGSHLCQRVSSPSAQAKTATLDLLPIDSTAASVHHRQADIRDSEALAPIVKDRDAAVVVHLAALAEAVMPFAQMGELANTNIQGTVNTLAQLSPKRIVFASSSAVYGSVHDRAVRPLPEETAAIGAYGASKLMGEVICTEWAEQRGRNSIALRFGNIVGPGCRGLIPYLVAHAHRHPEGDVVVQLRGRGRLVRDYLDVDTAVDCILAASEVPLEAGKSRIFNVGSGRGMNNREVAQMVAEVLRAQGFALTMNFDNPVPAGESEAVVLDVSDTVSVLGVPAPSAQTVAASIEQATLGHLARLRELDAEQG
jgi:UDP-glucose 4-epimerase